MAESLLPLNIPAASHLGQKGDYMKAVEIMLKEYETLRQESLTAANSRTLTLQFGLAIIGGIIAAATASDKVIAQPFITSIVLIFVIQPISMLILVIWLGEHQRIQRAGLHLTYLERRINQKVSEKLLTWENNLRKDPPEVSIQHMQYPYIAVVGLVTLVAISSFMIGLLVQPSFRDHLWIFVRDQQWVWPGIVMVALHLVVFVRDQQWVWLGIVMVALHLVVSVVVIVRIRRLRKPVPGEAFSPPAVPSDAPRPS
jgi:hypothetical protein